MSRLTFRPCAVGLALFAMLFALPHAAAVSYGISRASVNHLGLPADRFANDPQISADGRYVAFICEGTNLDPTAAAGSLEVYVRDRVLGTTERVSRDVPGHEPVKRCQNVSFSADGRYVAFLSTSRNGPFGAYDGYAEVFVRDRQLNVTERVSVSTGGQPADRYSAYPEISADGRFVAFSSLANNLTAEPPDHFEEVFLRDRQLGTTARVTDGTGYLWSQAPTISADGRYVAFHAMAGDPDTGILAGTPQIYVWDRNTTFIKQVSYTTDGQSRTDQSYFPSMSADGRYVVYVASPNAIQGPNPLVAFEAYLYDTVRQTTECITVDRAGNPTQGRRDYLLFDAPARVSADGRYVVFSSDSPNLTPLDKNGVQDVFVRDRLLGTTRLVSMNAARSVGDQESKDAGLSANGTAIVFASSASNLAPGNSAYLPQVFVADLNPSPNNQAPIANAGPAQEVSIPHDGDPATHTATLLLDGSRSHDPEGDPLTYVWEDSTGAGISTLPAFARVFSAGKHSFRLRVTDPHGAYDEETVTLHVRPEPNRGPIADPGPGQQLTVPHDGDPATNTVAVTLNGSNSFDLDNDALAYRWRDAYGTVVSTQHLLTQNLTPGKHSFRLRVTDPYGAFDEESISIHVLPEPNPAPVADAGIDQVVSVSNAPNATVEVHLDGIRSGDRNNDPLTYEWTEDHGFLFTTRAIQVQLPVGIYRFRLTVTDSYGASSVDEVTVHVRVGRNRPPVARAGADQDVRVSTRSGSAQFTLNGSRSSDPEGDDLTYQWRDPFGNLDGETPVLTLQRAPGVWTFYLTVTDSFGTTSEDRVTVRVLPYLNRAPYADAGGDIGVAEGKGDTTPVTLFGNGSFDPDGDELEYVWTGWGSSAFGATPTIQLPPGQHRIKLTVRDAEGVSATDVVYVTVGLLNVTGDVLIRKGRLVATSTRSVYSCTVQITNRTRSPLPHPLSLVVDGLPATIKVNNHDGTTTAATGKAGIPYLNLYDDLLPGHTTSLVLYLTVRGRATVLPGTFRVFAGIGDR